MNRRFPIASETSRGAALVIVLWISLGLASLAMLFGHAMMVEYRAAANSVAGLEAAHAVQGALVYISETLENLEEPGRMPLIDEEYFAEEIWIGDSVVWFIGRERGDGTPTEPVFGLVDEASKLNLNTASQEMLQALCDSFTDMPLEIPGAIVDWRDEDDEISEDGAETETYMRNDPSYECKNGAFETVEELRLVYGVDMIALYGEDPNRNGALDLSEDDADDSLPEDNRDGRLDPGLLEYLTVYSYEPNLREDGEPRINVNDEEQAEQLLELLVEELGEERAGEVQQGAGGQQEYGSVLEYAIRAGLTEDELALIDRDVAVSDEEKLPGLVNINTAPEAVLACIPGIGEEYAASVVSYRQDKEEELYSALWILNVLDEDQALEAAPFITTHSYQYSIDVAALGRGARGFRREQFILDLGSGKARVLFRKDISRLGWPLGKTLREEASTLYNENERRR